MKILHLTLKKKYFDMVGEGKPEEYRELNDFWASRLFYKIAVPWGGYMSAWGCVKEGDWDCHGWHHFTGGAPTFNSWDAVLFANGGHFGDVPKKLFRLQGIEIREGNPEWGAEPGKKYFVIILGDRIF